MGIDKPLYFGQVSGAVGANALVRQYRRRRFLQWKPWRETEMATSTVIDPSADRERIPRKSVGSDQRSARLFGVLFILTFVTSIPAYIIFGAAVNDPAAYIAGSGSDNLLYLGALLEFLLIIANIGTAVVLYPIARRQNRPLALGYVAARIVECVFLAAGIVFVLGIVSLRQDAPGAADLAVSLGALKEWTFLLGPGFVVPFGNGLILGYLMYKSGLVPRQMTWFGLVGGPILLISSLGTLFGLWQAGSSVPGLLVAPEFIWEAYLGVYCAIWGFRSDSPILEMSAS